MRDLVARVRARLFGHLPLAPGQTLVCAVSGGADSVALLHILREIASGGAFLLRAAHFDHAMREDSAGDAQFVRHMCGQLGIPVFVGRAEIPLKGEDEARRARYEFLSRVCRQAGAEAVAVGHHRRDQAETVLLHLTRGSGLNGLCGMRTVSAVYGCRIVRPLLDVSPEELGALNLPHVRDNTNERDVYARNRVRLNVLPELEKINPRAIDALCRLAQFAQTDEEWIEKNVPYASVRREGGIVILPALEIEKPLLLRLALRAMRMSGAEQTLANADKLLSLLASSPGGREDLSGGVPAYAGYGEVTLGEPEPFCFPFSLGLVRLPHGLLEIRREREYRRRPDTEYLDADALPKGCLIRTRREGDRIRPLGAPGSKNLSDYFMQKKVSRGRRSGLPLICGDAQVYYAAGCGISEHVRLRPETKNMISVFYRNKTGGN